MNIWLTSDLHFMHDKSFIWESRGFFSIQEMNEKIVENWNNIVKPDDRVICLGDLMLNNNEEGIKYINQLNGEIILIWGNHDTNARQEAIHLNCPSIITLGYAHQFRYEKFSIYLSHYPTITSNFDDKNFTYRTFNLHGHTHSLTPWIDPNNPFMYDVGMDAHNCKPILIDNILDDIYYQWKKLKGDI